jgi:hypothetical protein
VFHGCALNVPTVIPVRTAGVPAFVGDRQGRAMGEGGGWSRPVNRPISGCPREDKTASPSREPDEAIMCRQVHYDKSRGCEPRILLGGAGDGTRTRDALLGRHRAVSSRRNNSPRLMQRRFSSPVARSHPQNREQGYRARTEPGSSILDRRHLVQRASWKSVEGFGAIATSLPPFQRSLAEFACSISARAEMHRTFLPEGCCMREIGQRCVGA